MSPIPRTNWPPRRFENQGGYRGERIETTAVLEATIATARARGWRVESLDAGEGIQLPALTRPADEVVARVYLSAGIHGDEPAGLVAAQELIEEDCWPGDVELYCCPCLNPSGAALGRRENAAGLDLNRDYRAGRTPEVRAHTAWLRAQPKFDLTLCLHEDWEAHGFYLYELNPDGRPSFAERMLRAVRKVCPIDSSEVIEGRPASAGLIRPVFEPERRPDWPEAFFLVSHQTRLSYTLEAPSDFPLAVRVQALKAAVGAALRAVCSGT